MATVLAPAVTIRPAQFALQSFTGFVVLSTGKTKALDLDARDLADAVAQTVPYTSHKSYFAIRQTDTLTGATTLHWHTVKQKSTPRYVLVDHVQRAVRDLYAEPLFSMEVEAFAPVAPWAWAPGVDFVGDAA